MTTTTHKIAVWLIGGRIAVIEIGGLRWLTDPTVHAPGPDRERYSEVDHDAAGLLSQSRTPA